MKVFSLLVSLLVVGLILYFSVDSIIYIVRKLKEKRKSKNSNKDVVANSDSTDKAE